MSEKEITIDLEKKYNIPYNLVMKEYRDKILIISPECANWIVVFGK